MKEKKRVSGFRSLLSPVYGKYAPDTPRVTETTEIISEMDAVLATGRVEQRTDKVYGLWNRAGERHAEKGDAVIAANSSFDQQHAQVYVANRTWGVMAGFATAAVIAICAWVIFS